MDFPGPPNRKIGRNELCWCHSGKKYKKCHLDRDKAPRKQPWEIAAEMRKERSDAKYCLHAEASAVDCSGRIIKAHSLPRQAALAAVAESGHVYGPDSDFMSIVKNRGVVPFKRIGVRDASTFTGFCGAHDDRTFAPIEKEPLIPTAEQCFLMGYRIVCRELFQKSLQHDGINTIREMDHGHTVDTQGLIQWFANLYEVGTLMGLAELQRLKVLHDEMLTKGTYENYRRLVIRFSKVPDVLSAGGFAPEYDFQGRQLQLLSDPPPLAHISVSLLPADGGGLAVLGWDQHSDKVCLPFVQSLATMSEEDTANAVVRLVFEHIENTYLRPSWFEGLDAAVRNALLRRTNSGADPTKRRRPNCLMRDGDDYVNWPVSSIQLFTP